MTPEEYETMLYTIEEQRANCNLYSLGFTTLSLGFTHWQRHVLPRSFYVFAFIAGSTIGHLAGYMKTNWYLIERVDALG